MKGIEPKERFDRVNEARKTLAQVLGGILLLAGFFGTWQNIKVAQESAATSQKALEVSQQGQITDRFTKAIEQLGAIDGKGNKKLEVRLGGIYSLERIANESERDHWPIMEVLCAYVRENAPRESQDRHQMNQGSISVTHPTADIQAILTVLGRRDRSREREQKGRDLNQKVRVLDLRQVGIKGVNLDGASLSGANLSGADLRWANLRWADLTEAKLNGADLRGADLTAADLSIGTTSPQRRDLIEPATDLSQLKVVLRGADLGGADLRMAQLGDADLRFADLSKANLRGVELGENDLRGANLAGADLNGADLTGADLRGTDLERAGLRRPDLRSETSGRLRVLFKNNSMQPWGMAPHSYPKITICIGRRAGHGSQEHGS